MVSFKSHFRHVHCLRTRIRWVLVALFWMQGTPSFSETEKSEGNQVSRLDVGANSLLLYRFGDENHLPTDPERNGFHVQELGLSLRGEVKQWFDGYGFLVLSKPTGQSFQLEPSQVYVTTQFVPVVQLRVGKMNIPFGFHNELNTHQFPFVDAPLFSSVVLSVPLNDVGVAVKVNPPLPWVSDFWIYAVSSDHPLFTTDSADHITSGVRWRNEHSLSSLFHLEWAKSYLVGKNPYDDYSHLLNGALTVRHGIVESPWLVWSSEYAFAHQKKNVLDRDQGGLSTWIAGRFFGRWWAKARGEWMTLPTPSAGQSWKYSGAVSFAPVDWWLFRVQSDWINRAGSARNIRISFQTNVSFGHERAHLDFPE